MKVIKANLSHRTHRQLELNKLVAGEVLVFDVYIKKDSDYLIIVQAGTILSDRLYIQLQKQDKLYISVKDEAKKELTAESLLSYIKYNKKDLKRTLNFLYDMNNKLFSDYLSSQENKIDIIALENIVKGVIYLVNDNPHYLKETVKYFIDAHELAYHSLHVSIYAVSIGHLIHLNKKEILELGLAALVHDLGVKMINDSIISKDSKLNLEELEAMHQHPKMSVDIARKNHIHDPFILNAILNHHESHDGSGYPSHRASKDISNFASIVSISDNFDALTNSRPYRKKYSTFEALKIMMKEDTMVNKFNQEYLRVFLESLIK